MERRKNRTQLNSDSLSFSGLDLNQGLACHGPIVHVGAKVLIKNLKQQPENFENQINNPQNSLKSSIVTPITKIQCGTLPFRHTDLLIKLGRSRSHKAKLRESVSLYAF